MVLSCRAIVAWGEEKLADGEVRIGVPERMDAFGRTADLQGGGTPT